MAPVVGVRLMGEDGNEVATGEVGEIWIKAPSVMRGYHNDPAATNESFTDGWFHTGDAGRIDHHGFVYILDRLKDVVIRGGENIYSAEVEAALFEHRDVLDAAIIGLPDATLGERVAAVVRLRPGASASAEALCAHVAERLAAFKVPSSIYFRRDELPRNAAGKVLKRQLRDELDDRTARLTRARNGYSPNLF
jgi:long-chain acyl-CoA synthetase